MSEKITLFHAKIIKELDKKNENLIIGFHGQTIYHNSQEKVSRQLGDANLLFQLTKKIIIFNFRKNDILNGGGRSSLGTNFSSIDSTSKKNQTSVCILNIGGISNITLIKDSTKSSGIFSKDIGPGNCLIDSWVRQNSNKKFDNDGKLALLGNKNQIIFEQAQELYANRKK